MAECKLPYVLVSSMDNGSSIASQEAEKYRQKLAAQKKKEDLVQWQAVMDRETN